MVKDHSDSEKENPLPPHRLLLSINSKGSFIYTIPPTKPIQHNKWDGPSYHWNTAMTHQCRHRPSPLGLQQYPLSTSCSRSYSYKSSPTGTTAVGHSSSTLALSAMEKSPLLRWKSVLYFDGGWQSTGLAKKRWWRETHGVGKASWFWAAIGINHKAGPVVFHNTGPGRGNGVMALRYINQVLQWYFGRHQHHMFPQDNARAHTTIATRDFLQQHNIKSMPWPALSPDLNPTELVWDESRTKLNEVRPRPITAADLSVAFLRIWAVIPVAFINRLIHSMYRRCVSVVNAHWVFSLDIDS